MYTIEVLHGVLSSCLKILSYSMELHAGVDLAKPSGQQPGESEPYRCNTAAKEHPAEGMLIPALSLQQLSVEDG